jgi:site-specific DNA-cytosine methylase
MNAMYYGIPQSRQRMIFVGVKEDLWNCIQGH